MQRTGKAIQAILKEYKQLHDLNVFQPMKMKDIPIEERDKVLRLITLIKEKRTGQIKGRACADGRPQRAYISREEATSPTVSFESLITSMMIDAYENCDVATADVAGTFLKGDMDDFVMAKLMNEEVDIMRRVEPKYRDYVIRGKNGRKILLMKLNKALYGCMKSAIIWYETFVTTPKDLGFKLNPYDPCVANLKANGKQLTIACYVDDTKISHEEPRVVTWLLNQL